MLYYLVKWIFELFRSEQQREWKDQDDAETDRLRQEHRERLAGIPPHLRSTNLKRQRRPRGDAEMLGKSTLIVGGICLAVFGLCLVSCIVTAVIGSVGNSAGGGNRPGKVRPAPVQQRP